MSSRVEQFRSRLAKLEKKILEEELDEIMGSTSRLVSSDDSVSEDYPVVTCPICGEEAGFTEAQRDREGKGWMYYDGSCEACDTEFVIGEVPDRCALCEEPFPSDSYQDVNELYHHTYDKGGQTYYTACYMQLFFDGLFDLSSDNTDVPEDESHPGNITPYFGLFYTHVGNTVAPYYSRLVSKGYEEVAIVSLVTTGYQDVATAKEWHEIYQVCRQIVSRGRRYLILSTNDEEPGRDHYIIYQNRSSYGVEMGENQTVDTSEKDREVTQHYG